MTGIARFVTDPEIRKILRDTDGLGTEATRAGIIELLFQRGFLQRQGKTIRATPAGKGLISSLPDVMVVPDMTAQWEKSLNAISQRQEQYQAFMTPLQQRLHELINLSQASLPMALQGVKAQQPAYRKRSRGRQRRSPRVNPS
jgi:DNA topoisomerase-3